MVAERIAFVEQGMNGGQQRSQEIEASGDMRPEARKYSKPMTPCYWLKSRLKQALILIKFEG